MLREANNCRFSFDPTKPWILLKTYLLPTTEHKQLFFQMLDQGCALQQIKRQRWITSTTINQSTLPFCTSKAWNVTFYTYIYIYSTNKDQSCQLLVLQLQFHAHNIKLHTRTTLKLGKKTPNEFNSHSSLHMF
jgi:hypothetical protein